ncbi:hypothetical protein JTB14_003220 [Gonioctena quinquepunctata]|nr:hypothetical protein JTB14_003220 [Gonioctena quinquepunctata]
MLRHPPKGPSRHPPFEHGETIPSSTMKQNIHLGSVANWDIGRMHVQRLFCFQCGRNGIMSRHCPCENSLKNRPEAGTARVQTHIQEKAVIPKSTDNRPFVIITIGESRFYALLDTGATRSFDSEAVGNCCIYLFGLEPSSQTRIQPRQADGMFCTITQAFSPQMTVGQKSLVHELLILLHLTVDIILGMDILSNKFRIDLASNTVFLNGRDVSCKESQPLMYLHVSEGIVEPIPSNPFPKEQRIPLTLILLSPPPIEETVAGSPEGGQAQKTDFETNRSRSSQKERLVCQRRPAVEDNFEAPAGCSLPSLLDPVVTGKVARTRLVTYPSQPVNSVFTVVV